MTTGCGAVFTRPASMTDLDDHGHWMQYAADRRGALLVRSADGKRFLQCSEPAPDVAMDNVAKLMSSISVPQAGVTAGADADVRSKAVELAGRSQTIMFQREALFRLCEHYVNGALTRDDIRELYPRVIDASVEFARAQQRAADADEKRASAAKVEAETERTKAKAALAAELRGLPQAAQETLKELGAQPRP